MDTPLSTLDQLFIFEHYRRHSECRMYPLSVVILFNILEKFSFRMIPIVKIYFRKPFAFQCSEKRFCNCVIPTVSFPTHALDKMMHRQRLAKGFTAILYASIGMDHQPRRWPASPYSAIQRLQNPFMTQGCAYTPSHDHPGKKVDKNCQVQPSATAGKIGYIADQNLVRSADRKVTVEQILCHGKTMLRIRRNTETPLWFEPQPLPLHTGANPLPARFTATKTKFQENTIPTIMPFASHKSRLYLKVKQLLFLGTFALGPAVPVVITAPRYLKHLRHPFNRKFGAVLFHKPVDFFGFFEKMATAFFKMSRSSCAIANSRRRRRFSASRGFRWPVPGKALVASAFTSLRQCRREPWYRPSSFSIVWSFLSEELANRTDSRLNVPSYFFRVDPIKTPPRIHVKNMFGSWSVQNQEYGSLMDCPLYTGRYSHILPMNCN